MVGVVLAGVLLGSVLVVGSGVSAQSVADVVVRDRLIADQENLLNTYRCLFGVDLGAVPGGCPNPDVVAPAAAPQNPTQHDLDVRDGLIQRQEALLNVYRCRFGVDTEIVSGGCPETGVSEPTPEADPTAGPAIADSYSDVPSGSPHADSIDRLRRDGVLAGTDCADGRFCPDQPVTGLAFATWLTRIIDGQSSPDPIARLVELGVAANCADRRLGLCPDGVILREQMATFLDRAFAFPNANMQGFVDVDESSVHSDSIRRAWASRVMDECNFGQEGPMLFCPDEATTRAEAATLLSWADEWKQANDELKPTGTESAIALTATYDEENFEATLAWSVPNSILGQVESFVVQWREPWRAFDASSIGSQVESPVVRLGESRQSADFRSHKVVDAIPNRSHYSATVRNTTKNDLYAARLVVVYKGGELLATREVKVPANSHRVRDLIWQEIVSPNQRSQPWLKDVWRHINEPEYSIHASKPQGFSVGLSSEIPGLGQLELKTVDGLTVSSLAIDNFDRFKKAIIHEMGHIYSLTNNISVNPAPKGIGFLYLQQLYNRHSDNAKRKSSCVARELYADLAVLAIYDPNVSSFSPYRGTQPGSNFSLAYWGRCGLDLSQNEADEVSRAVADITKSVFLEQDMPDLFYDTYGSPDGSVDLDKLWSDIHERDLFTSMRVLITHDLRDSFGGYCSDAKVRQLLDGQIAELNNHWRDAGCDKPEPHVPDAPEDDALIQEDSREVTYSVSYTLEYLNRARARPDKCWIAIGNYVYDVTQGQGGYDYPGPGSINDLCGTDATSHFAANNLEPPGEEFIKGTLRR